MTRRLSGPRFVLLLYAALVAVTGLAGYLIATTVSNVQPPEFLFLIEFPATPLGLAVYGALTIAVVLGVPLLGVVYFSQRIDDPDAASDERP